MSCMQLSDGGFQWSGPLVCGPGDPSGDWIWHLVSLRLQDYSCSMHESTL